MVAAPRPTQPPVQCVLGLFPGGAAAGVWRWPTHLPRPAPKLSMIKPTHLPPLSTCLAFYESALLIFTFIMSPVGVAVSKFIKSKYAHINNVQPTVRKFPSCRYNVLQRLKPKTSTPWWRLREAVCFSRNVGTFWSRTWCQIPGDSNSIDRYGHHHKILTLSPWHIHIFHPTLIVKFAAAEYIRFWSLQNTYISGRLCSLVSTMF